MQPHDPPPLAELELLRRLSGMALSAERLQAVLVAYGPIFEEIARLRDLDLQEVHPAVVFEPTAPYRLVR